MIGLENTKYEVKGTTKFKKQLKKSVKQGKDITKLIEVLNVLSNGEELEGKYQNHNLVNNKYYKDCKECHIEPDWLLIYKYNNNELILFFIETGSHSELFNK
ncbi:MAG: type II toxin-antitoxin system YafQ family toxin [Bacilli bacterium]